MIQRTEPDAHEKQGDAHRLPQSPQRRCPSGDAREESFYSCLETLLGQFAVRSGRSEIHVTTLPKKTEAGNPDFRVWNGQDRIVGYIEAKKPTAGSLDSIESTEQLQRYRQTFPNLILTNFFEFRLYRDGQLVDQVLAARPFVLHELGAVPPVEKGDELFALLEQFFSFSLPRTYTAESLAVELAKRTRFLRHAVFTPPAQVPLCVSVLSSRPKVTLCFDSRTGEQRQT